MAELRQSIQSLLAGALGTSEIQILNALNQRLLTTAGQFTNLKPNICHRICETGVSAARLTDEGSCNLSVLHIVHYGITVGCHPSAPYDW
jgi:hypothetical protein